MSDQPEGNSPIAVSGALTRAIRRLLRPVIGLLLDYGLTYTWLNKVLKRIFVDVAESEFAIGDRRITDSRISVVTGVHRRDVNKIRSENNDNYEPPASIFLGPKLVAIWVSDPRFLDRDGLPAVLPRNSSNETPGGSASFDELVSMVRTDIRPRSVLDELLRLGVVSVNESDEVCLVEDAFIPARGIDEKMYYLGRNIHDHIAASRANVNSNQPPFFERSVYYDGLSQSSIRKLNELSRKKGGKLLQELNSHARVLQMQDSDNPDAKYRMNFGGYFYTENERDDKKEVSE